MMNYAPMKTTLCLEDSKTVKGSGKAEKLLASPLRMKMRPKYLSLSYVNSRSLSATLMAKRFLKLRSCPTMKRSTSSSLETPFAV